MAVKNELSPNEVLQRTSILRRFRELLKSQRDRFVAYLDILEKQNDVIEKGSADSLILHVELEEKIVEDIFSIQKVINPLEDMYQRTRQAAVHENDEVIDLKSALEGLRTEAIARSKQNRLLLSKRMAEVGSEIKNINSSPYVRPDSAISAPRNHGFVDIQV